MTSSTEAHIFCILIDNSNMKGKTCYGSFSPTNMPAFVTCQPQRGGASLQVSKVEEDLIPQISTPISHEQLTWRICHALTVSVTISKKNRTNN